MIGAVVLAAGASSRIGRAKALLTLGPGGPTFVGAIEDTLRASGVASWRVVVAPGLAYRGAGAVVNPEPHAGMLSSVQCGLRALGPGVGAALVWPVDHPLVTRETILAMIDAFRAGNAPVVVPAHLGRRGHPVLFAARIFAELLAADPAGGARAVVHAHGDRVELDVGDRGVVLDIDTPEDYERVFGAPIPASPEVV